MSSFIQRNPDYIVDAIKKVPTAAILYGDNNGSINC